MTCVNILLWQPSPAIGHLDIRSRFPARSCNRIAFHFLALCSDLASRECNSSTCSKRPAVQFGFRCQIRHCCDRRPFQPRSFRVLRPWMDLRAVRQAISCMHSIIYQLVPCLYHSRFTKMRDLSSAPLINICLSFTCFPTFYTLRSCKCKSR